MVVGECVNSVSDIDFEYVWQFPDIDFEVLETKYFQYQDKIYLWSVLPTRGLDEQGEVLPAETFECTCTRMFVLVFVCSEPRRGVFCCCP